MILGAILLLCLLGAHSLSSLTREELSEVRATCVQSRALALAHADVVENPRRLFVPAGSIPDMWLRDSAAQFSPFLHDPAFRADVSLLVRTHAFYILQDAYANSFRAVSRPFDVDLGLRRGGWVATGNWEPDSLASFLHLLVDADQPELLRDPLVLRAVNRTVEVFITELNHEARSPYRYAELPRGGRGARVAVTGMVWGAFRPSDEPQAFGYNVPVNMYIHAALTKLARRGHRDWRLLPLSRRIARGIARHGVVDGAYVYETDGLGHALEAVDDANWPSLLSAPLLGYVPLDAAVYAETRRRILSAANPYFFSSPAFEGIGSSHTPPGHVWSLSVVARALTAADDEEADAQIRHLLAMRCGTGAMVESVAVSASAGSGADGAAGGKGCTRRGFPWANAAFVRLVSVRYPGQC